MGIKYYYYLEVDNKLVCCCVDSRVANELYLYYIHSQSTRDVHILRLNVNDNDIEVLR